MVEIPVQLRHAIGKLVCIESTQAFRTAKIA
jgi:hypothetical protein